LLQCLIIHRHLTQR